MTIIIDSKNIISRSGGELWVKTAPGDDFVEDVFVVEIHLVVDWIVDWIVVVRLVSDVPAVFELVQLVYSVVVALDDLLLQGSLQVLPLLAF
jgi:hypothetical protein